MVFISTSKYVINYEVCKGYSGIWQVFRSVSCKIIDKMKVCDESDV